MISAVVDRGGSCHARLAWYRDALVALAVGDRATSVGVGGETVAHPIFGLAHPLWIGAAAEPSTWMGAVRWSAPATIPPIFAPALLPAGTGTMILNVLALLALDAGVDRLRYAGPYPTGALWRSLLQCFRVVGDGGEDDFTAGALERALRGDMSPVAVDFAPAPFERMRVSPRVTVQLRDGLERATIDGATYDRSARDRRLVTIAGGQAAELWLGSERWCRIAELDDDGTVRAGPEPVRPVDGALASMIDQSLPPAMCAALADVVAELVAPPLAAAARDALASARVVWGDAGAAEVATRGDVMIVHAGLWAHLAPHGLAAVARGLALALAGPIAARAQARLVSTIG